MKGIRQKGGKDKKRYRKDDTTVSVAALKFHVFQDFLVAASLVLSVGPAWAASCECAWEYFGRNA